MAFIKSDVVILGAGIAGLAARRLLLAAGRSVILVEKSRGLGGRMSTRRDAQGMLADLGAQYTSTKNEGWKKIVESMREEVVPVLLPSDHQFPRFVHRRGMSALARVLLSPEPQAGSELLLQTRVTQIEQFNPDTSAGVNWKIICDSERILESKAILITAPAPQALELLQKSDLRLTRDTLRDITAIQYDPCLAMIITLHSPVSDRLPPLLKNVSNQISGIFDQRGKGLTTSVPVLVVHASPDTSRQLWDRGETEILDLLLKATKAALSKYGIAIEPTQLQLHRWKYCEPQTPHPEPFLAVSLAGQDGIQTTLWMAGDGFGRASIDGAYSSGEAAAQSILNSNLFKESPKL